MQPPTMCKSAIGARQSNTPLLGSNAIETLPLFSVAVPPNITSAIETMHDRVNVMKHEAGLELGHFISEAGYIAGVEALEEFWNHLTSAEKAGP